MFSLAPEIWAASLVGIGHLPDGTRSEARAISADGTTIVGVANDSEFIDGQAILWTRAGGMTPLGDLPGGAKNSYASGVSGDGKVIVGTGTSVNSATGPEAFIWTEQEGMRRLTQILPSHTIHSAAMAVSANGQVVTGFIEHPAREAFRWTAEEGLVLLGDLPGGPFGSEAWDISADGAVIVGNGPSSEEGVEAFRWTAENGMIGLGHLAGSNATPYSVAAAVSADGSVIVGLGTSANAFQAFRRTATSGMKGLGFLSEDIRGSGAIAVSDDGRTVGGWTGTELGEVAFIWTEAQGMRKLWDVLLSHGVNPAADGWETLRYVTGFSADGRLMSGTGVRNGREEGFLAQIGVQLVYARTDGGIELTWPAGFRLERTTVLKGGSWQALQGANSPLQVNFGAGEEFFRLVAEP